MVIQAGLLNATHGAQFKTNGLIVRAVVIQTYFADEEKRPGVIGPARGSNVPKAVAADVLTYGGRFRYFLPRIPVAQPRHGLNDHNLWIPRATSIDISTGEAPKLPQFGSVQDQESLGDPRDFDGDHVLVEFLEGDIQQGFIRADQLPHPRSTFRMERADGERKRSRFRGVIQEIDEKGNWTLDATGANDGTPDATAQGAETPAVTDPGLSDAEKSNFGNATIKASNKAEFNIFGVDDTDGDEQYRLRMKAGELLTQLAGDVSLLLTGNQGNTNLAVGDGAVAVAIAEHLSTLWGMLKSHIDAHVHPHTHTHTVTTVGSPTTQTGTTGPPTPLDTTPPSSSAPAYDTAITSTKVTIPDG